MFKKIGAAVVITASLALASNATANATPDDRLLEMVTDSYYATCATFDEGFTGVVENDLAVTAGVLEAVVSEYGIDFEEAAKVVNTQVYNYCPRNWDNLKAVGEFADAHADDDGNARKLYT